MTFDELKSSLVEMAANPNTSNKLAASLALNDYKSDADRMREALEAIASHPATPRWLWLMAIGGLR